MLYSFAVLVIIMVHVYVRICIAFWLFKKSSYCHALIVFFYHHSGSHTLSLRELDQLPHVAAVWYRLGLHLGVGADDLDVIEKNYPRDADLCKIKMFAEWLRSDTDPTYEKLVRALAAVGKESWLSQFAMPKVILSYGNFQVGVYPPLKFDLYTFRYSTVHSGFYRCYQGGPKPWYA